MSIHPAPAETAMAFDGGPITSASLPLWHGSGIRLPNVCRNSFQRCSSRCSAIRLRIRCGDTAKSLVPLVLLTEVVHVIARVMRLNYMVARTLSYKPGISPTPMGW